MTEFGVLTSNKYAFLDEDAPVKKAEKPKKEEPKPKAAARPGFFFLFLRPSEREKKKGGMTTAYTACTPEAVTDNHNILLHQHHLLTHQNTVFLESAPRQQREERPQKEGGKGKGGKGGGKGRGAGKGGKGKGGGKGGDGQKREFDRHSGTGRGKEVVSASVVILKIVIRDLLTSCCYCVC